MYCCSSLSPSQSQPAAARTVNPTRVSGGGVAATLDIQERTGPAAPDSSGEKSTNRKSERFLFEIKGERAYGEKEMAVTIAFVKARKIFDSCGNPTVEGPLNYAVKVDIALRDGSFTRGAVSSSASTGIYEALELRDGGPDYLGKGVLKVCYNQPIFPFRLWTM